MCAPLAHSAHAHYAPPPPFCCTVSVAIKITQKSTVWCYSNAADQDIGALDLEANEQSTL